MYPSLCNPKNERIKNKQLQKHLQKFDKKIIFHLESSFSPLHTLQGRNVATETKPEPAIISYYKQESE